MIDPLTLSLSALPSVPFADMLALPEKQAVYFALDSAGKPLYIGATRGLRSRWQGHHAQQRLIDLGCTTIAYLACEIEEPHELQQLESRMIEYFNPIGNAAWQRRLPLLQAHWLGVTSPSTASMEKANKVTISMRPTLWHAFRMACLARKTSASKELQRLIEHQLAAWQRETQKESDHA